MAKRGVTRPTHLNVVRAPEVATARSEPAPEPEVVDADLAALVPGTPRPPLSLRPEAVYLAGLEPSGRRSMRSRLAGVAALLGADDLAAIPWERLRYPHYAAL